MVSCDIPYSFYLYTRHVCLTVGAAIALQWRQCAVCPCSDGCRKWEPPVPVNGRSGPGKDMKLICATQTAELSWKGQPHENKQVNKTFEEELRKQKQKEKRIEKDNCWAEEERNETKGEKNAIWIKFRVNSFYCWRNKIHCRQCSSVLYCVFVFVCVCLWILVKAIRKEGSTLCRLAKHESYLPQRGVTFGCYCCCCCCTHNFYNIVECSLRLCSAVSSSCAL